MEEEGKEKEGQMKGAGGAGEEEETGEEGKEKEGPKKGAEGGGGRVGGE